MHKQLHNFQKGAIVINDLRTAVVRRKQTGG